MNGLAVRASLTVAAVYGFFLLFAQFAFVELIRAAGTGLTGEKVLLGAMALTGVLSGFLTAWRGPRPAMIRAGLVTAAVSAAIATVSGHFAASLAAALLAGGALGTATVALAALLPGWCGVVAVGFGTGLGYALCNIPAVFQATPSQQAWIAAGMAAAGAFSVPATSAWSRSSVPRTLPFPAVVLIFTALVWMDSAAFFIIQHAADLKSGTWGGTHLWRNALVHFSFAVMAGFLLTTRSPRLVPLAGWILLAVASLAVNHASSRELAGWLYPAGVSLYSAALVAWPGWFCGAGDARSAGWKAAWLFAVAGWFGSANGIGMAQTLHHVPAAFIAAAGLAVIGTLVIADRRNLRPALAVGIVAACALPGMKPGPPLPASAAARGRLVYLSEGCIHCHSRYTRPGSQDESIWGPAPDPKAVLAEKPVLIGNRRQGPDLANVGARRSEAWLKAHFIDPRAFSPGSTMPSYAHLFEDGRGDDLVRYLRESGIHTMPALIQQQSNWTPAGTTAGHDASALYGRHCAVCHGAKGGGYGPLAQSLGVRPPNLHQGPFPRTGAAADPRLAIARVIKFGVIGSDMPGHETLADGEILALAELLAGWRNP